MFDLTTVGHLLVDMRMLVDEFPTEDRLAEAHRISYGGGGSAGNVAYYASLLGLKTACIGKVGMDRFGRMSLEELIENHINISGVKIDPVGKTGFTVVMIKPGGKIIMAGYLGVADKLRPKELDDRIIKKSKVLHVASINIPTAIEAMRIANEVDALITYDAGRILAKKGADALRDILKYVDVIFPNRKEIVSLTGISDYEKAGKKLLEYGIETVVLKLGGKGAMIIREDLVKTVPAFKVEPIDTTGAGDSFAAAFIYMTLRGEDVVDAVRFANAFAAIKTTKLGARAKIKMSEVEEIMSKI